MHSNGFIQKGFDLMEDKCSETLDSVVIQIVLKVSLVGLFLQRYF